MLNSQYITLSSQRPILVYYSIPLLPSSLFPFPFPLIRHVYAKYSFNDLYIRPLLPISDFYYPFRSVSSELFFVFVLSIIYIKIGTGIGSEKYVHYTPYSDTDFAFW